MKQRILKKKKVRILKNQKIIDKYKEIIDEYSGYSWGLLSSEREISQQFSDDVWKKTQEIEKLKKEITKLKTKKEVNVNIRFVDD